jgi:hypothetical protein
MRTLSFSGLLFVCGTLTVGCNAWVDIEPIDPPGGDNGYGGSGGKGGTAGTSGSGTGGYAGGGTGGSGTGGYAGGGTSGSGTGGYAGGGTGGSGTGGSAGGGNNACAGLEGPGFGEGSLCAFSTFTSDELGAFDCNSFFDECQNIANDLNGLPGVTCSWNGVPIFTYEDPNFPGVCGGTGGTGGSGGDGGAGGKGGSGGDGPLPGDLRLVGGDVDEQRETFPFGVAVAPNGAVFVSTLGNRDNEPSRIYRFNPGENAAPEILFEVGNAANAAIYGLGFSKGKLYACSSDHLLSSGFTNASILEFDAGQLGQTGLGPQNVKNTQLRSIAINADNNGFVINTAVQAGRCGQFAIDNDGIIYAPDVSGQTDFIFRLNPAGTLNQPLGQPGDPVDNATLAELKVTAWFQDPQLVGNQFGTTGITFDGNQLRLFLENNGAQLFNLRPVGVAPEGLLGNQEVNQALAAPFGVAALDDGRFLASDLGSDELVVLTPDQGTFNASVLFDSNDDNAFLQPASIAIAGDNAVVVGSQLNLLGAQMSEDGTIFVVKY